MKNEKIKIFNSAKSVYYELNRPKKKAETLVVFMTGFSGGKNFPLFKNASNFFLKQNYETLRLNFCNEPADHNQNKDALNIQDISVQLETKLLKELLDKVGQDKRIILVGHSFGAIIALNFLTKYKSYKKKTSLVIWEPSFLPWGDKVMGKLFIYSASEKLYRFSDADFAINKKLYRELKTINSINLFKNLNMPACLFAAKGSADKDIKKYFSAGTKKATSKYYIILNSNHFLAGHEAQKELFTKTLAFLRD